MLTEQEFLRRAREPNKKPNIAIFNSETGEYERTGLDPLNANGLAQRPALGQHKHTTSSTSLLLSPAQSPGSDDEDDHPAPPSKRAISLKRWAPLPQPLADKRPDPKYLADRRPGLAPLYGHLAPAQNAGAVEAATAATGGVGADIPVAGVDMPMPMPVDSGVGPAGGAGIAPVVETPKRRPPPPPPKRKKKGGPGRSRKKVEIEVPNAAGAVTVEGQGQQAIGVATGVQDAASITAGQPGLPTATEGAQVPLSGVTDATQSLPSTHPAPSHASGPVDTAMPDADADPAHADGSSESGSDEDDEEDEREGSEDGEIDESDPHAPSAPAVALPVTSSTQEAAPVPVVTAPPAVVTVEGLVPDLGPAVDTTGNEMAVDPTPTAAVQDTIVPDIAPIVEPAAQSALPIPAPAPISPPTVAETTHAISTALPETDIPVPPNAPTLAAAEPVHIETTAPPSSSAIDIPGPNVQPDQSILGPAAPADTTAEPPKLEILPTPANVADTALGEPSLEVTPATVPPAASEREAPSEIPGLAVHAADAEAAEGTVMQSAALDLSVDAPVLDGPEAALHEGKVEREVEGSGTVGTEEKIAPVAEAGEASRGEGASRGPGPEGAEGGEGLVRRDSGLGLGGSEAS